MFDTSLQQSNWIWLKQEAKIIHQYVCFRRVFNLSTIDQEAIIDISVDSDFILYLNDNEIGRGQFSDYPQDKTFSRFQAGKKLRKGKNVISVLAYYRGEDFSEHRAGNPGLILSLTSGVTTIHTDSSFKCIQHPAFTSGPMPKVTGQQGFTTCFDAESDIPFNSMDFDDSGWEKAEMLAACTKGFWKTLKPRPVPTLKQEPLPAVTIPICGYLKREKDYSRFAEAMENDFLITKPGNTFFAVSDGDFVKYGTNAVSIELADELPLSLVCNPAADENANGIFFVIDSGSENTGLIYFDIETPSGAVLDIGHGEHLEDGRVRVLIEGRNFADRYICKAGRNIYTLPFRRIGARYLQIHITNCQSPITIHYFGLKPLSLPGLEENRFHSSDSLANKIHEIGIRTLKLCMHEHYEDTPWREQALYAFDARNQALYGYYCFGNYDFAAASLDLLGRGIRDDGLLELCAPARISITIPIFSLVWITALYEHWLHCGSSELFAAYSKQIEFMISTALANNQNNSGLYQPLDNAHTWHFYEWTSGLSNHIRDKDSGAKIHAAYNLFLHETLGSYSRMLIMSGLSVTALKYQQLQFDLGSAIHRTFWQEDANHYASSIENDKPEGFHKLIQLLALNSEIVPEKNEQALIENLSNPECQEISLSAAVYLLKALTENNSGYMGQVLSYIKKYWEPMIMAGSTTCWETQYGAADFNNAGSLCHGWSALPVYYYHANVLGIRPLTPGFTKFLISPYCDGFHEAEGEVTTPAGKIRVEWHKNGSGIVLNATGPKECKPVLVPSPGLERVEAKYNDKEII